MKTQFLHVLALASTCFVLTGCPGEFNSSDEDRRANRDPYRDPSRDPYSDRRDRPDVDRGPDRVIVRGEREDLQGWTLLGRREVDFRNDHDTLVVGGSHGKYRSLKLTVDGGDLELYDLVIQVGDDYIRPSLRHHFSPGTASPTIDLPGDKRTVGRVDFYYRSADRRDGRAIVSLYGR